MTGCAPAPWDALRDAAVRDLAWLLGSPDLLAGAPGAALAQPSRAVAEPAALDGWLAALDGDPAPLHAALAAARPTRLGRYAECLLAYFAQHAPSLRLVAANLPLRRNGRTLGECDFLIETARGERLHWELAVKCYLCAATAGDASLSDFVGPALADRFDVKWRRLVEHQLLLSAYEEVEALGGGGPWTPQMVVKGWLFYRAGSAVGDPPQIGTAHARGFWVPRSAWLAHAQSFGGDAAWIVLPRFAWLAPRRIDAAAAMDAQMPPQPPERLIERFAPDAGPLLVAAVARDGDGAWSEIERGFVVPDDWPSRASAFAARERAAANGALDA